MNQQKALLFIFSVYPGFQQRVEHVSTLVVFHLCCNTNVLPLSINTLLCSIPVNMYFTQINSFLPWWVNATPADNKDTTTRVKRNKENQTIISCPSLRSSNIWLHQNSDYNQSSIPFEHLISKHGSPRTKILGSDHIVSTCKLARITWCCSLSASRPCTGTAVPQT